jgi:hypothetical protein
MNHIHKLQREVRALIVEKSALLVSIHDLAVYLQSSKFNSGHELDGYVQVGDVLRRLEESVRTASNAGEEEHAAFTAAHTERLSEAEIHRFNLYTNS